MDYKELIDHLKNIRFLYADDGMQCASVCKDAATAIETLLAEREAADDWELASDGDGIVCPRCREDFCTMIYDERRFRYCPNCGKN